MLIKNHAIATNPADKLIQQTGFFVQEYPAVIGFDVAGTVEAVLYALVFPSFIQVGEGVTRFKKGDKVLGLASIPFNTRKGAFQEYTIVDEHYAGLVCSFANSFFSPFQMPDNVSFEEGSALIAPTITTASSLFVDLAIPKPTSHKRPPISKDAEVFYVNSAASAVGAAAVQLLAICGFRVIATASPKNFDLIKSFGASDVFDYNDAELVQKVKTAAGTKINLAFDAASNDDSIRKSIEILEGTGNLVFVKPSALNLEKKNVNSILANYSKIVDVCVFLKLRF